MYVMYDETGLQYEMKCFGVLKDFFLFSYSNVAISATLIADNSGVRTGEDNYFCLFCGFL